MPGLDPGIHSVSLQRNKAPMEWIAGSSPAMTEGGLRLLKDDGELNGGAESE
jgi:hypothetical protein